MKDAKFIEILEELKRIHEDTPSLRFGEVIQSAIDRGKKKPNYNLHDLTSKQILKHLKEFQTLVDKKKEIKITYYVYLHRTTMTPD